MAFDERDQFENRRADPWGTEMRNKAILFLKGVACEDKEPRRKIKLESGQPPGIHCND